MSTPFSIADSFRLTRHRVTIDRHQSSSWLGWAALLNKWLRWSERSRQRADLRDLDEHLLKDIGIPVTLKELGLPEDKQDWTAESAITAARLVNNNPRLLDVDAMKAITRAAFSGDRPSLAS